MRTGLAVACTMLFVGDAVAADVARLSIEVTTKGELTVVAEPVADEDFAAAEGKAIELFGVPGADAKNDDGFVVLSHKFTNEADAQALGPGLRVENDALVADTSGEMDNIGPRS